jgi:hypothetical protein
MLGSSRVAAQLAASREGLGSMSDDEVHNALEHYFKALISRQFGSEMNSVSFKCFLINIYNTPF